MSNTLKHFGILGMRWGVRRSEAQLSRARGSTNEGKKKAKDFSDEDLKTKVNRLNLEKQYNDLSKETKTSSKTEKVKKAVDATSSLVNQAKTLNQQTAKSYSKKLDLSKMTDQQLRDRINRTNLERQYNDLFGSEAKTVSKGQIYATNVLNVAGATLAVGSSVLGIALAIKELRG